MQIWNVNIMDDFAKKMKKISILSCNKTLNMGLLTSLLLSYILLK